MIIILKSNITEEDAKPLLNKFTDLGLSYHFSQGASTTVVGLIGDTSKVDMDLIKANDLVEDVKRVSEPYNRITSYNVCYTKLLREHSCQSPDFQHQ